MEGPIIYYINDWARAEFIWQNRDFEMEHAGATSIELHVTQKGVTQTFIATRTAEKLPVQPEQQLELFAKPV